MFGSSTKVKKEQKDGEVKNEGFYKELTKLLSFTNFIMDFIIKIIIYLQKSYVYFILGLLMIFITLSFIYYLGFVYIFKFFISILQVSILIPTLVYPYAFINQKFLGSMSFLISFSLFYAVQEVILLISFNSYVYFFRLIVTIVYIISIVYFFTCMNPTVLMKELTDQFDKLHTLYGIKELNFFVIGLQGSGKSSLCLSISEIFGKQLFTSDSSSNKGYTDKLNEENIYKNDIVVNVIDTPGRFDSDDSSSSYKSWLYESLNGTVRTKNKWFEKGEKQNIPLKVPQNQIIETKQGKDKEIPKENIKKNIMIVCYSPGCTPKEDFNDLVKGLKKDYPMIYIMTHKDKITDNERLLLRDQFEGDLSKTEIVCTHSESIWNTQTSIKEVQNIYSEINLINILKQGVVECIQMIKSK